METKKWWFKFPVKSINSSPLQNVQTGFVFHVQWGFGDPFSEGKPAST
jgi:hypothetical protein